MSDLQEKVADVDKRQAVADAKLDAMADGVERIERSVSEGFRDVGVAIKDLHARIDDVKGKLSEAVTWSSHGDYHRKNGNGNGNGTPPPTQLSMFMKEIGGVPIWFFALIMIVASVLGIGVTFSPTGGVSVTSNRSSAAVPSATTIPITTTSTTIATE